MIVGLLLLLVPVQDPPEEKQPEPPKQEAPSGPLKKMPDDFKRPRQKEIDQAIDSGAAYLIKTQQKDGSWPMGPDDLPHHAYRKYMGRQILSHTAFCLLTLLHADIDPKHKAIKKAFAFLRKNRKDFIHTYNCAVTLMAIDTYAEKLFKIKKDKGQILGKNKDKRWMFKSMGQLREFAHELTLRLVYGQLRDGSWTYGAWDGEVGKPGSGTQVRGRGNGRNGKPKGKRPPIPQYWTKLGGDLSNTQYALLGLRAASEIGIPIDINVWLRSIKCLLGRQEKEGPVVPSFPVPGATEKLWPKEDKKQEKEAGSTKVREGRTEFHARGWGYAIGTGFGGEKIRPEPYGAMTLVGIVSLVTCKYYLNHHPNMRGDLGKRVDESIEDGCAWILNNFSVKDNVKYTSSDENWKYKNEPPNIDGYYMYSLERVGVLAGLTHFGALDWYALGARLLIDQQAEDGSWKSQMTYEPLQTISTCFAVLFLKRATKPMIIETHGSEEAKKHGKPHRR